MKDEGLKFQRETIYRSRTNVRRFARHNPFCVICEGLGIPHHIRFKSQGGGDEDENLATLCPTHHDLAHFKAKPYLTADEIREAKRGYI